MVLALWIFSFSPTGLDGSSIIFGLKPEPPRGCYFYIIPIILHWKCGQSAFVAKLQKLWPKWQKIGGHCRCRGWLLRSSKWHLETSESLFLWTLSSPSHGHMVGQGNLLNFILPHCYPCPLVIGRAFPFWKVDDDFCAVGKDKAFCMSHHLSFQSRRNLEIIQIKST